MNSSCIAWLKSTKRALYPATRTIRSANRRNRRVNANVRQAWVFESLRTFRYEILNLPAKIARAEGRTALRLAAAPETQNRIAQILDTLPKPA